MTVEYNTEIEKQIISHLDGWVVSTTQNSDDEPVEPFIDDLTEFQLKNANKKISSEEVEGFFNIALDKCMVYCNRFNINDLTETEEQIFIRGVCLLTASDLWNKYNIRVNNEDMEDTYIQSYGGLLYKQALLVLKPFIHQKVIGLQSIKKKPNKWSF